jgi:branched-chain amino acid aminotransferase
LIVWHDGRLVDGPLAIDPADRGLLLGDGAYETIAVHRRQAVWRREHIARLIRTLTFLGIPVETDTIEQGIDAVLQQEDGILRVTVTRGPTARGLAGTGDKPSILITLAPWIAGLEFAPAKLITAKTRRNERSMATRHKTLSYIDNILAAREAQGADDALMLNTAERLACSTIANVFIVQGTRLITPPESEGALPGIARQKLIEAAKNLGLEPAVRPIEPAELTSDTALFLTNSLRLLRPVTHLDGRLCAAPEPAFSRLAAALRE